MLPERICTKCPDPVDPVHPGLLVPFLFAALIETAQGSRVVTAVITAEVLAGSAAVAEIHPIPLILLVSAGSCIVSYVTDPFFWLVQRTTGDNLKSVVKKLYGAYCACRYRDFYHCTTIGIPGLLVKI